MVRMPRWHKSALLLATVLLVGGLIGQSVGYVSERSDVSWMQSFSPKATRIGLGFIGGFLVGWLFRAFIRWVMLAAGIVIAVMIALSYFNIDVASARHQTEEAAGWLTTRASELKDFVRAHIASGAVGLVGMFVGARRH